MVHGPWSLPKDTAILYLLFIVFLGMLVQGLVGFGSAMVIMALLSERVGLGLAGPLVALMALPSEGLVLLRYRGALNWRSVRRLAAGMVLGVPVGILALRHVPERPMLVFLGVLIAAYALYALLGLRLPALRRPGWAYLFGWVAGAIGGAYNTSGPPVVVYGTSRGWPREEFKGNLQAFFLLCDLAVVTGHGLAGHLTRDVWTHFAVALPVILLGAAAGMALDRVVPAALFRRLVLALLLVLGVRLLL
jgi:uncharacterized membrane protein YfcA